MKDAARFVNKLRGLNFVRRWNFHPHNRLENVAEHSFWVAIFTALIAPDSMRNELVLAALVHDAEESVTGDLPALVKRHVPTWPEVVHKAERELFSLDKHEGVAPELVHLMRARELAESSTTIKIADLISALMYCREELTSGNKAFARIEKELIFSIKKKVKNAVDEGVAQRTLYLLDLLGFKLEDGVENPEDISHL